MSCIELRRTVFPPVLWISILLTTASACSDSGPAKETVPTTLRPEPVELTVYAAASTRDAIGAINAVFEAEHPVKILVNFGSSGDLSRQIVAAAKADVFLSADEKELDRVERAGLLALNSRRSLLSNQLVVIEPIAAPLPQAQSFSSAVLASTAVKHLSLANVETVPAGRYAKTWLESKNLWTAVADRVLPAIDVRSALAAVESGGAEAGIVYRTDVIHSSKARIAFTIPMEDGPRISYPVAVLAGRPHMPESQAFVDFLCSERSKKIWEGQGFVTTFEVKPTDRK